MELGPEALDSQDGEKHKKQNFARYSFYNHVYFTPCCLFPQTTVPYVQRVSLFSLYCCIGMLIVLLILKSALWSHCV